MKVEIKLTLLISKLRVSKTRGYEGGGHFLPRRLSGKQPPQSSSEFSTFSLEENLKLIRKRGEDEKKLENWEAKFKELRFTLIEWVLIDNFIYSYHIVSVLLDWILSEFIYIEPGGTLCVHSWGYLTGGLLRVRFHLN